MVKNIILLKVIILFYLLSSSFLIAHSTKKKKSLKSHEHGVGVLNIAQEGNILLFEFEIPGEIITCTLG